MISKFYKMKKVFVVSIVLIFLINSIYSQQITSVDAIRIATLKVKSLNKNQEYQALDSSPIKNGDEVLAYVVRLVPTGYIVVSSIRSLSPIPAYSFESDFGLLNHSNSLMLMLENDLKNQKKLAETKGNEFSVKNEYLWLNLLDSNFIQYNDVLEQWPSSGNGWLQTSWSQTAPYSNFCPIDPVTSQRSYTGCPATAMSQILNFHRTINGTHFNDNDDYFHNYAGRQYNIDDDSGDLGFPSFPELNMYLDTLQSHWNYDMPITNNDKAALNFACGVAATQVFTSEGSGTFSVSQAYDAYRRFGCETAVLIQPDDLTLIERLIQNMKDTLPAHLAIVDSAWSTGHNVVVDGYNSDGYFHVNFGWGGSSNGWYLIPEEMPYELTYFEGVVLNIMSRSAVNIAKNQNSPFNIEVFPNPFIDKLNFKFNFKVQANSSLSIFDDKGRLLFYQLFDEAVDNLYSIEVPNNFPSGIFFYLFTNDNFIKTGKIVKVE